MDSGEKSETLFMRVPEFAREARMSKSKAYESVKSGEIPAIRIAGLLRIPRAALEKFAVEAMKPAGEPERAK